MIRVGPAGWSYADWEGTVYPRRKPAGFHPLRLLARSVDCVELNSSFYATPRAEHAERWVQLVADHPEFRFTAKLQNVFTHDALPARAAELRGLVEPWLAGIEPLRAAGRLSAVLLQFPLGFRHTPAALERLDRLDEPFGHLPRVIEVRHRSWFEPTGLAAIEERGLSLARIDLPSGPDHPPADAPARGSIGYLRLHGRNAAAWFDRAAGRDQRYDYLYAPDELSELSQVARRLAVGRDETFVITNNHFSGKAVANALELLHLLGRTPLAPVELIEAFPRLRDVARPDGQATLF